MKKKLLLKAILNVTVQIFRNLSIINEIEWFRIQKWYFEFPTNVICRMKSEKVQRDFIEELEALKQELVESHDKTQANLELRTEREKQYLSVKVGPSNS